MFFCFSSVLSWFLCLVINCFFSLHLNIDFRYLKKKDYCTRLMRVTNIKVIRVMNGEYGVACLRWTAVFIIPDWSHSLHERCCCSCSRRCFVNWHWRLFHKHTAERQSFLLILSDIIISRLHPHAQLEINIMLSLSKRSTAVDLPVEVSVILSTQAFIRKIMLCLCVSLVGDQSNTTLVTTAATATAVSVRKRAAAAAARADRAWKS